MFPRNRSDLSFHAFASADDRVVAAKLRELADLITASVRGQPRFAQAVSDVVSALRELGHTIDSFDEDEDFERWTSYGPHSTGDGLTIDFQRESTSVVSWRFEGRDVSAAT